MFKETKSQSDMAWLMQRVRDCDESEIDAFIERVAILVHDTSLAEDDARSFALECLLSQRRMLEA